MRKKCVKLLSFTLAAMLSMQTPCMYAGVVEENENVIEVLADEELDGAINLAEISDNTVDSATASQDEQEENLTEANADDSLSEAEMNAVESSVKVNYLYIEDVERQDALGTNIVVSLGDENTRISDAKLQLVNKQTGLHIELAQAEKCGDAYRFSTKDLGLNMGLYQVASIAFLNDETNAKEAISFGQIPGMEEMVFGVMEDPGYSQEEMLPLEALDQEEELDAMLASELASKDVNLSNLVSIEVQDLNGASNKVTEKLLAANANVAEDDLSIERASDEAGFVKIFLDAGHDAVHAGARANGLYEEALTLRVAQYCKEYLLANYTNVQVMLCRESGSCPHPGTDSATDNKSRVADASNWGADAYVAIHFNSAAASAAGAMVFYPNASYNADISNKGALLSTKILEQLVALGLANKGIHIRNSESGDRYADGTLMDYYTVIRYAKNAGMPGVIVEHAFLTNASDAAFLKSEENIKKLGYADALGIANAYQLSAEPIVYTAKSLDVTDIDGANGSFKISVTGAKPVGFIDSIKFEVFPESDKKKAYVYTAVADAKVKGTYSVTGGVENHGNLTGKYKVIAYACDAMDRRTKIGNTTFEITQVAASNSSYSLNVKKSSDLKKVTFALKGNGGAAEVVFKVTNEASGTKITKSYKGTKANDIWNASFLVKDFKAAGEYTVVVQSKNYYGVTKKLLTQTFEIEAPTLKSVEVKNLNMDKGTFQLRAVKVASASGVKKVELSVKNLEGKQSTKVYNAQLKGSYYGANIDLKDFNYQLGEYEFEVYVTDGNECRTLIATENETFEMPDSEITAKLKANETKLVLSAKNLGIGVNIKGVRFKITRKGGVFKKKYYDAKYANGAYGVNINVTDLAMEGTYKIQAYVKGQNNKEIKAGKMLKVTISDILGGKVSVKTKTDTSSFFYVDSISANSPVTKVEVKAWPTSKSSAKYTYIAQQQSGEKFRALIEQKKHQGLGGDYKYEVTVTLKNGVSKKLLTGKFVMGEDSDEVEEDTTQPYVTEDGFHTITGPNGVTVEQMMSYYLAHTAYPAFYKNSDAPTLKKFCTIYYKECQAENIRVEVAFVQAMKETNFLRYTGDVQIGQFNFAGIGATGGGVVGNSFPSVAIGVRAQVQHLKAYANTDALTQACVDPRFTYVKRGNAPYVEWLGIPDNPTSGGWAAAQNYGSSIITMVELLKSY